ncbi:VCBS repeat-containing protein [Streptomyces sp. NPDC047971]|uniref:FG-GAP repeat domain-containing protein n=1 Tax=Streptomyces sp. NPDC047971 TaxID=3154499 RepID=UPI0033DBA90C
MASARTTRRRLGASVATVLAVTVGAGVLAAPGAVAAPAPAAVTGAAAATADEAAHLPVDAEIVSNGDTGYLTSRTDEAGNAVLEWHTYADGSVIPITSGTVGHGSNSDVVVTSDGAGAVALRDMTPGVTWSASFDLASEFGPGAKLVGVVGRNLFVSVPTTADYHELWQLTQVDGVTRKTKRSANPYSQNFKVVASTSSDLLVLRSNRVFPSSATFRTEFWNARMSLGGDGAADGEGAWYTGPWNQSSTGAYTADHRAWVEYKGGVTHLVVKGTGSNKDFAMDSSMSGAVIAGITRDTLLYGVPGKAADETPSPLYARSVVSADSTPYKLLQHFSSVAQAPDGGLLVRGATADTEGLFRIWEGDDGRPTATLVASTGRDLSLKVTESKVPTAVDLEKPGTAVPMEWTLSRANATVDLTLTHTATGAKLTQHLSEPISGSRFAFAWDGVLGGISAPNGAYTWQITATPANGGSPATTSGTFQVSRQADPHDFNDNGSTDVLARDASGVLWRDDLFDWPGSQVATAKRTTVGTGWGIYNQIEATGNIGGAPVGDVVARDTAGVLWLHLGKGDGTFANRYKIGSDWGSYNKIAGGSDFTGDGKPDLLAVDTAGAPWLFKGTGSWSAPFAPRVSLGTGWGVYNQITATGNIAGGAAGDLVARDSAGVLWLHLGNGDGTFANRVKIGTGWGGYTHLVGAGDVTGDGRPDLIAYGPNGTHVHRATGSWSAPYSQQATTLYAGEGTKFNHVA